MVDLQSEQSSIPAQFQVPTSSEYCDQTDDMPALCSRAQNSTKLLLADENAANSGKILHPPGDSPKVLIPPGDSKVQVATQTAAVAAYNNLSPPRHRHTTATSATGKSKLGYSNDIVK